MMRQASLRQLTELGQRKLADRRPPNPESTNRFARIVRRGRKPPRRLIAHQRRRRRPRTIELFLAPVVGATSSKNNAKPPCSRAQHHRCAGAHLGHDLRGLIRGEIRWRNMSRL